LTSCRQKSQAVAQYARADDLSVAEAVALLKDVFVSRQHEAAAKLAAKLACPILQSNAVEAVLPGMEPGRVGPDPGGRQAGADGPRAHRLAADPYGPPGDRGDQDAARGHHPGARWRRGEHVVLGAAGVDAARCDVELELGRDRQRPAHGARRAGENTATPEARWGGEVRLDKTAQSFGAHGQYVDRAEDIGTAVQCALASGKPAVIHVEVDQAANSTFAGIPGFLEFRNWFGEEGDFLGVPGATPTPTAGKTGGSTENSSGY